MMNVKGLAEIRLDEIVQERTFDFFIGYICGEARSIHVFAHAHQVCENKIVLRENIAGDTQAKLPRKNWLKKEDQINVIFHDDDLDTALLECEIENRIENVAAAKEVISILLDISSMPRSVMASVMAIIHDLAETRRIDLTVAYCLAKYTAPVEHKFANKTVRPVHSHFTGFTVDAGLPVAAIVGLGYEKGKALGAVEYIQSSDWWIFVPTSAETRYSKKVDEHNQTILKAISDTRRFEYSIHSPLLTVSQLESLVSNLVSSRKPILLPFGPKIFFFCSLLVSLVHRNCAVWDVVGETPAVKADVSLSADITCLSFSLEVLDTETIA